MKEFKKKESFKKRKQKKNKRITRMSKKPINTIFTVTKKSPWGKEKRKNLGFFRA
jgi:hypothetical protein